MSLRVGVFGATGLVGRTMLALLEERRLPIDALKLIASQNATARHLQFRGRSLPVEHVDASVFAGIEIALFAVPNAESERWAQTAISAGAIVIDNSSAFRYRENVPLVIPEINGGLLGTPHTLIANPNCSTIAVVMALAPLAAAVRIERVAVVTYQSVSGAGAEALAELEHGVRQGLDGPPPNRAEGPAFAFNVIPHIDRFEPNGYTREEMKIVWESRKILDLPDLPVTATAARVPVRIGHCASVNVRFSRPFDPIEARDRWAAFEGIEVVDDPERGRYPTPLQAAGKDAVLVGRVRRDLSDACGLEFFVASDNLRKGAALNAVQIAERLIRQRAGTRG